MVKEDVVYICAFRPRKCCLEIDTPRKKIVAVYSLFAVKILLDLIIIITFPPQKNNISYFEDNFGPLNCLNQTKLDDCVRNIGLLTRALSVCENYSIGMLILVILAFIAGIVTMFSMCCVDFYNGQNLVEIPGVVISWVICVILNLAALICVLYGNGIVWNAYSQDADSVPTSLLDFVYEIIQNGIPSVITNVLACFTFLIGLFWL